ncbi:hypothetical protein LTR36_007928 [Oleoguttula mirabilis]|uniref:Uncharacterized protein n=1 Tax=Oleoguttula mirabilis TaxID=1507867 RepID=A0AAV9J9H4_9PEZI|nr:hypothetical protein LTR36_007928 [Oleoguttula mirabilis]
MEKQNSGGCVRNTSSVAGLQYIGEPQIAHTAPKAAITQFTNTAAVLYVQKASGRVRLKTVVPGLLITALVLAFANDYAGGGEGGFWSAREQHVPMGSARDVAHAELFWCSDEAGYKTGPSTVISWIPPVGRGHVA